MNIEKFILPISNDENKILGKMSAPLSCNKLVISSNFKLNNESYFGNGYNITSLMNSISNNSDNFTQFNNYTNFNYILTFGINSNKIEDIVVSMIIIDKDENIINLDFNINSLKDPNVYYNLSFKNDSSDLQNLLELDTKFSLKIPLEYKNNNFDFIVTLTGQDYPIKTFDYCYVSTHDYCNILINTLRNLIPIPTP